MRAWKRVMLSSQLGSSAAHLEPKAAQPDAVIPVFWVEESSMATEEDAAALQTSVYGYTPADLHEDGMHVSRMRVACPWWQLPLPCGHLSMGTRVWMCRQACRVKRACRVFWDGELLMATMEDAAVRCVSIIACQLDKPGIQTLRLKGAMCSYR